MLDLLLRVLMASGEGGVGGKEWGWGVGEWGRGGMGE